MISRESIFMEHRIKKGYNKNGLFKSETVTNGSCLSVFDTRHFVTFHGTAQIAYVITRLKCEAA